MVKEWLHLKTPAEEILRMAIIDVMFPLLNDGQCLFCLLAIATIETFAVTLTIVNKCDKILVG